MKDLIRVLEIEVQHVYFRWVRKPGKRYDGTRHNIGFDVLDLFAKKHGVKINKIKHKALMAEFRLHGEKVILVKPQTYMNFKWRKLIKYS